MVDSQERLFEDKLEADRELVSVAISDYLPEGEPRRWLYDLIAAYPARGGKGFRSGLCLATCRAFGGSSAEAIPSAVAIELLHNAFLIHDDAEDGSEQRRGYPTLHMEHGLPLAINAGDGLAVLAMTPLRDNVRILGTRMSWLVGEEFDSLLRRSVEGQAIELGWQAEGVTDITPEDYLDLILLKTCSYSTIHPLRVGALIGSWGTADLAPLTRFGFFLGAAFQIQDDILNLVGHEASYGKEIRGDLYEGKRTLIMIHLLSQAEDEELGRLESFLSRSRAERSESDVQMVSEMIDRHGSIEFARHYATGIADAAYEAFDGAFEGLRPSDDLDFIRDLIAFMLERRV